MKIKFNKKTVAGIGVILLIIIIAVLLFLTSLFASVTTKYGTPAEHGISYKVE